MKYFQITEVRPNSDARWFWQEFESRYPTTDLIPLNLSIAQYNLKPNWCKGEMPDMSAGMTTNIDNLTYTVKFLIPEGMELDFFEEDHEVYLERLEYSANHGIEIQTSIVED